MEEEFFWNFSRAKLISKPSEAFFDMNGVRVSVFVNGALKNLVSEERLKNRFELTLRHHGIPINDDAHDVIEISVQGLANDENNGKTFTYVSKVSVITVAYVRRNRVVRLINAPVWQNLSYGYAGVKVLETEILNWSESNAEALANNYLEAEEEHRAILEELEKLKKTLK